MTATAAEPDVEPGQGPPAAPDSSPISDAEVRDWARATGRKLGDRGRVSAALKAEYATIAGQLAGDSPGAADPVDATPSSSSTSRPREARAETRPRPVRRAGLSGRLRSWLGGESSSSSSKTKAKAKAKDRPERTPLTSFAAKSWGWVADFVEHVNVPVARCMDWQAPYVGTIAEDALKGTVVDRILQPVARLEGKVTGGASVILMPVVVGLLQRPENQPEAGLLGVARNQMLSKLLEEIVDVQLELFGSGDIAMRARRDQAEREERRAQRDLIIAMIFAAVPDMPADPKEAARQQEKFVAEERARREAAAHWWGEGPPPGATVVRGTVVEPTEPDTRGQAAERAAADMAAAGNRAALATVHLGSPNI